VTGKPLFIAPRGRSFDEFVKESKAHGWPSFRDEEVVWENMRCLKDGEAVSVDGTHLGHNLPDRNGNRLAIALFFPDPFSFSPLSFLMMLSAKRNFNISLGSQPRRAILLLSA
jgi:hypothetical protein